MKLLIIAAATACLLMPASVEAQETDDWVFVENPAERITLATADYDSGHIFAVLCHGDELYVSINGVPQGRSARQRLAIERGDGRRASLSFRKMPGIGYQADRSAETIALFRGPGIIVVTNAGTGPEWRVTFELPPNSHNVDRVLAACGRAPS